MSTWIKFCGTTSVEDALAAVEAGAGALGFIFAPSPRRVTVDQARQIIHELPQSVERVGVFREQTAEEIGTIVGEVALTGIQLHGGENTSAIYDALPRSRRESLRIIKTVIVQKGFETRLDAGNGRIVSAWLLDSGAGSGKTFDWQAARTQLGQRQGRFIIAGGLTPGNVDEAIRTFSPWGVDVVSGIEREPGRKDRTKMEAFVTAVRKAEQR